MDALTAFNSISQIQNQPPQPNRPIAITIIDLSPREDECRVCGLFGVPHHGIPMYEDEIVPDDYTGPWAGFSVCPTCYALVRGLQERCSGKPLSIHAVRPAKR